MTVYVKTLHWDLKQKWLCIWKLFPRASVCLSRVSIAKEKEHLDNLILPLQSMRYSHGYIVLNMFFFIIKREANRRRTPCYISISAAGVCAFSAFGALNIITLIYIKEVSSHSAGKVTNHKRCYMQTPLNTITHTHTRTHIMRQPLCTGSQVTRNLCTTDFCVP